MNNSLKDTQNRWFSVTLSDIDCASVVGIYEWEQIRTQPLRLDVIMGLPPDWEHVGKLEGSVDYTVIVKAIQFFCQHGQWLLLEDIAEGLMRWLLHPPHASEKRARIERVSLTIRKPDVLGSAAVPSVTYTAESVSGTPTSTGVFILVETPCVTARRVQIEAGKVWKKPARHSFFVISGALDDLSGVSIVRGGIHARTVEPREYQVLQDTVLLDLQR